MARRDGIESLRRAILADARAAADAEVAKAETFAEVERQRARAEAEREAAGILDAARREAEALRRRVASVAELEGKRRLLEARERLIQQLLDRAMDELRDERGARGRSEELMRLVVEAALEAGGGRLKVQTSASDAGLLTPGFLAEARERLAREGISADLEAAEQPAEIVGGAIVSRDDGRVIVDNSFDARLARQEAVLRGEIWRILSGRRPGES